jgi:hypothetical protein
LEINSETAGNHVREARWYGISNQLSTLSQITCELEVIGEGLQSRALAKCQIAVLLRMDKLRSGTARDCLRRLVGPQPAKPRGRTAATLGRGSINHSTIRAAAVAIMPQFWWQIPHGLTGLQGRRAVEVYTIKRPIEVV